uniref:Uncharacterized protein n=1 Tax=Candidatus Kentrum sp. DK TaxID=2126562 RepID=A0A450S8C2_9GAMM|nr:MAG: hypothetical protein BECKDK2373C_GA0170839_102019 [Candidatus Kentron sp. DK]
MEWMEIRRDPVLQDLPYKERLYFAAGAKEVWPCSLEGIFSFYIPGRQIIDGFPRKVDLYSSCMQKYGSYPLTALKTSSKCSSIPYKLRFFVSFRLVMKHDPTFA